MKITDQEDAFGYVIYWICLQRKFKRKVGEEKPKSECAEAKLLP